MEWVKYTLDYWCNNEGPLKRLDNFQQCMGDRMQYYSEHEQDSVMEIADSKDKTQPRKSAPGQNKQWHELPRQAQMNVKTDELVTKILDGWQRVDLQNSDCHQEVFIFCFTLLCYSVLVYCSFHCLLTWLCILLLFTTFTYNWLHLGPPSRVLTP